MKQRLTYLLRDPSKFSLERIQVSETSVQLNGLDAAKEQHLTLSLSELPQEVLQTMDRLNLSSADVQIRSCKY